MSHIILITKLYISFPNLRDQQNTFTHLSTKNSLKTIFFMYSFLEGREGKGGRKRKRETSMCGCLSCVPHWGPGLQSRHVLWPGIKPATLWFIGPCSIHWATPAKAQQRILKIFTLHSSWHFRTHVHILHTLISYLSFYSPSLHYTISCNWLSV